MFIISGDFSPTTTSTFCKFRVDGQPTKNSNFKLPLQRIELEVKLVLSEIFGLKDLLRRHP